MNNLSIFVAGLFVGVIVTVFNMAFAIDYFIGKILNDIPDKFK